MFSPPKTCQRCGNTYHPRDFSGGDDLLFPDGCGKCEPILARERADLAYRRAYPSWPEDKDVGKPSDEDYQVLARAYQWLLGTRSQEAAKRAKPITGEWLSTFCCVDGRDYHYKFVVFRQRADGSWDCWLSTGNLDSSAQPCMHLGNKWYTRGDVVDLLDGMKINTVKERA